MTNRRGFLQSATGLAAATQATGQAAAESDRAYWLRILQRLADPVLRNLAAGTLRRNMPVECGPTANPEERRKCTHLEALARLLAGIAPWLEAELDAGAERDLQQRYRELARAAIAEGADPKSPDYFNFHESSQPLVECGFLGQAILRAPNELWKKLDAAAQRNLASGLAASRAITPGFNNWLLFSATVEAALASMGERWDAMRIDYAVRQHQQWYAGDGVYSDGPQFHFDYYNSFVIQPMLVDVLRTMGAQGRTSWERFRPEIIARATRYAAIQERLIAPDGSYPAVGRSIAYRCGAFQLLAQMALLGHMPKTRSALTAVIHRTLDAPGTFDPDGWLTVGLCGHQPHLGESYISTGSLYLCSAALLPLGLKASDPFWSSAGEEWTAKRIWRGEDSAADHAL